ncbi:MAG: hydroxylamine oxidase, partial [Desulfosarcinaceae bacterium]
EQEVKARLNTMQRTCRNCHATAWVQGYFARLDNTIATTNAAVGTATEQMQRIWDTDLARGLAAGGSIFDEYIERRWSDAWLLYANDIRFVSAMAGGGDYGVFEDGRYHLAKTLMELQDWLVSREKSVKKQR